MGKISLFVPRESMLFQAHNILQEKKYQVDDMYEVKSEHVVEKARECISNGTAIFIARGLHATLIKQYTDATVIEIVVTAQEMALLIIRAKKIVGKDSPKIAVIAPKNMLCDMSYFENIYDISLKIYYEESKKELELAAVDAYESGADLIIGGETAINKANSLGMPSLFLAATEESLKNAFDIAGNVKRAMEYEKKSNAQLEAILDYSFTGVIKLGTDGRILVINKIMESFLGNQKSDGRETADKKDISGGDTNVGFVGKLIYEVIPDITAEDLKSILERKSESKVYFLKISDINIYAMLAPIQVENGIDGAILSCYKVVSQHTDRESIHRKYEKGFIAPGSFNDIICESGKMREIVHLAKLYSQSALPVMITGETGTERRLLAQSIHNYGVRSEKPFVTISCEGMREELQRELIYGESGAVYEADKGTILIEEIDRMSIAVQYVLFQMIKYRQLKSKKIDIRVICTGREPLSKLLSDGLILEELYYVLAGLNILIPPLRERRADLEIMIDTLIKRVCEKYSRFHILSQKAKKVMLEYEWKGNILQLDSFTERLILTASKRVIEAEDVNSVLNSLYAAENIDRASGQRAEHIRDILIKNDGNRNLTAKELGISKATLWRQMKKYNISM